MARLVADVLIDTLEALGVSQIFGVAGDSLNGITDAIRRKPDMRWVHTRHEEVAAFAAGAAAVITEGLAVCAGSCGPGNLHLINGLFDCQRNHVPVLAIAAHIPSGEVGSDYFQETHPQILFKECSVYCELVATPEQLPRMLGTAIQAALTHKGVAVLVLSGDVALSAATDAPDPTWPRQARPRVLPAQAELAHLAALLNAGKNITLLCGAGCAGAHDEVVKLAQALQAPVVHALRGKEYIEYDNPYDVGMTGLIGFASGYYAMESCDTLLVLGSSFPYRQFYPQDAKVIQVDLAGERLGLRHPLALGVVGDVGETIRALLPTLAPRSDSTHLDRALAHYTKTRKELDELAVGHAGRKPIHPQYLAQRVSELAAPDAIFTADVGTPTLWAARYLKMNGQRRLIGSFNHGSMANALAQALGAKAAAPQRQVVALCGDGGLTMLMGDLITAVQEKLPVKIVVFNNGALGFVELEMKAAGFLETATELVNPDFGAVVTAMGLYGQRVEDPADLDAALERAFAHDGPALIDVVTNRQELAMPPKVTFSQARGFSLYVARAILDGRAGQVLELSRTNLWR
ncbi:ubiquinone-dependent pyruvate dehydrogenase [Silvimonas amylolytica]|uniref:Pyruvate dehydrogenase [ubiquinone] n=1 Tax=Silvimonas amylolytica TaxID=449663 RepID=A0ABQ2PG44_9NEIS|nr:ubiquinone-dependent pyruvate dehydrogenase [Silvimonas amylolytica]GGP24204.1 pyruvate dehydrogenase [Silvimonas amylolytica]